MEQQRLYAWSEASGLLDAAADDPKERDRILDSNIFNLHRQVVLDLLLQTKCLFDEFIALQKRHSNLATVPDPDGVVVTPEKDARQANFPMTQRKRDLIRKVMTDMVASSSGSGSGSDGGSSSGLSSKLFTRLRWVSFDKEAFEKLLSKFSVLNDNMTSMLDRSLQLEIGQTVSDTNRGVLLLHEKVEDIGHLVMALRSELKMQQPGPARMDRRAAAEALKQFSQLAQFKAFNENVDIGTAGLRFIDEAAASFIHSSAQSQGKRNLRLPRRMITSEGEASRCMAYLDTAVGRKQVWIEWKEYNEGLPIPGSLSKADVVSRVHKLAALLNHSPKPESFCTPHCLGFFDRAESDGNDNNNNSQDADAWNMQRLGLVFERPSDRGLHPDLPPVSLRELLEQGSDIQRPRVTERVRVAHALSNCLLYLHAVNWLHKGIRSHNILFWRFADDDGRKIDYDHPVLSGFDFARPSGSDEMTEVPSAEDIEHDLYRHPLTQQSSAGMRERSSKSFDIYSLGIVLVELAHWRTVDDTLGIELKGRRSVNPEKARHVRRRLLERDRLDELGAHMGERFEEATRRCLAGEGELGLTSDEADKGGADHIEAQKLQTGFYEGVVKKLAEIRV